LWCFWQTLGSLNSMYGALTFCIMSVLFAVCVREDDAVAAPLISWAFPWVSWNLKRRVFTCLSSVHMQNHQRHQKHTDAAEKWTQTVSDVQQWIRIVSALSPRNSLNYSIIWWENHQVGDVFTGILVFEIIEMFVVFKVTTPLVLSTAHTLRLDLQLDFFFSFLISAQLSAGNYHNYLEGLSQRWCNCLYIRLIKK